ncbi:GAF domain-containing protein [Geodermatophilus sp. URMC 62]|uniref:GAF domain-containing protein n=1 Tax=Geodermatophilus sp. URMC 62 TaxID=3423414 RepID=UPI00406CDCF2
MTIAMRFAAALDEESARGPTAAELLPVRLARAAVSTLEVDGVGLSVVDVAGGRIPLGASSPEAACAERLQFTVGTGPCIEAQQTRQPVFAALADLHRRWPPYAELLVVQTPFRAAVALPLREDLAGAGALDLYFTDETSVPELDVFSAVAVGEMVTAALTEAAVWSDWPVESGPAWLHGPEAVRRAAVLRAAGRAGLALGTDAATALVLLRGAAYAAGCSVEDLAEDLEAGRLDLDDVVPDRRP